MVADTYSNTLGLLLMGTGNDNNSWGDNHNNSVTKILERAVAGQNAFAVTGGTLDLSGSPPPAAMRQDIDAIVVFTGTLTSAQTVILPQLTKITLFVNSTTGAFPLLIQGANTLEVPQGTSKQVVMFASGFLQRFDNINVGEISYFARNTVPNGYLLCDGSSLLRASYPSLFSVLGTLWGSVDGTHFTLPNLTDTGRFMRSSSGSLTVGTYLSNQNQSHTHTLSVTGTISGTTDNPGNHTHANSLTDPGHKHQSLQPTQSRQDGTAVASLFAFATSQDTTTNVTNITINNAASGAHTHTVSGSCSATGTSGATGGSEARPESAVMLACIRF